MSNITMANCINRMKHGGETEIVAASCSLISVMKLCFCRTSILYGASTQVISDN